MTKTKLLFGTAAACAAVAVFSLNAAAASAGVVDTASSPLAVRSLASSSSAKLTALAKGELVTLISQNGNWWYVQYSAGGYGYCSADYIAQQSGSYEAYVATNSGRLNVRSGPSTGYSVKATL